VRDVVPRLDLLGFTLGSVRDEYESLAKQLLDDSSTDDGEPSAGFMSFEEFLAFATTHAVSDLDDTFVFSTEDWSIVRGRFTDETLEQRIPHPDHDASQAWSERSFFGSLVCFLHPYSTLRILAENRRNLDGELLWHYGPLVQAGWASEEDFVPGARRGQTFLIATEGTSDIAILKRAFELLHPGVQDFIRFIDVKTGHPFSGTGSMVKFAEGLAKIDVQNHVLFLFDNDAEGCYAHQKVTRMNLPSNMRALILPELEEFRSFLTEGPEGSGRSDINRRAAAIECYLDLNLPDRPPAVVMWTNFKEDIGVYQGALKFKDSYKKRFLDETAGGKSSAVYDTAKLQCVLNAVIGECSSIAEQVQRISEWPYL